MRPRLVRIAHRVALGLTTLSVLAAAAAAQAQVGLSQIAVDGRPLTLVYPTAATARPLTMGPFHLDVARDAEPAPGRRRLVVLSHGTGGSPLADHELAATLARAGFVVAQPLHAGDHHGDLRWAGPESWQRRPAEVSAAIDALARDARWAPRLALDRVGVHGMSAGGVSVLALAGAQWRIIDLVRHCLRAGDSDFGFCFNGLPTAEAQEPRRARYEQARGVPEFLLPAELTQVHGGRTPRGAAGTTGDVRRDARIAAATLAVPVSAIFGAESLARIRVPVGVVSAGLDTMLDPAAHVERLLRECGACTRLDHLPRAAHMDLLAPWPTEVARAVATMHPRGGAPNPDFDAAARRAAFERIARFHVERLGPVRSEP